MTPGPWRAGLGSVWSTPGEQLICSEVSCPDDAALIAAAPALADALEALYRMHKRESDPVNGECANCVVAGDVLRSIGRPQ